MEANQQTGELVLGDVVAVIVVLMIVSVLLDASANAEDDVDGASRQEQIEPNTEPMDVDAGMWHVLGMYRTCMFDLARALCIGRVDGLRRSPRASARDRTRRSLRPSGDRVRVRLEGDEEEDWSDTYDEYVARILSTTEPDEKPDAMADGDCAGVRTDDRGAREPEAMDDDDGDGDDAVNEQDVSEEAADREESHHETGTYSICF